MSLKFKKNNKGFVCEICGKVVEKHKTTSRDHCNYCLYSKHVDVYPGDRKNSCKGILEPISIEVKNQKTKIIFKCQKCRNIVKNIISDDDNKEEIEKLIINDL